MNDVSADRLPRFVTWPDDRDPTREWCLELVCVSGSFNRATMTTRAWPIDPTKVTVLAIGAGGGVVDLVGLMDPAASSSRSGVTFTIRSNNHIDVTLPYGFREGVAVYVRYSWRPPKLRNAEVKIRTESGESWVSLAELQDALTRGVGASGERLHRGSSPRR